MEDKTHRELVFIRGDLRFHRDAILESSNSYVGIVSQDPLCDARKLLGVVRGRLHTDAGFGDDESHVTLETRFI